MAFSLPQWSYGSKPVANVNVPLYMLTIRFPSGGLLPAMLYVFPLPPQQLRRDAVALNQIYDSQGTPTQFGVQRNADQFGLTLPLYVIEGTTGWKLHSSDGYIFTGLASAQRIELMFQKFAQLNQTQMQGNNSQLYTMEFYDFFNNDYYEVMPIGPQGFRQTAQSPLNTYYSFRFAAMRNVGGPFGISLDGILSALGLGGLQSSIQSAVSNATQSINGLISSL